MYTKYDEFEVGDVCSIHPHPYRSHMYQFEARYMRERRAFVKKLFRTFAMVVILAGVAVFRSSEL